MDSRELPRSLKVEEVRQEGLCEQDVRWAQTAVAPSEEGRQSGAKDHRSF